ncbi:MAG: hypothetical protein A6F72_04860 [Cycloclasticus sp. symbiont of Poecilosclerida sp. N]|nr:MAG: hypothetical protein A6F72_04860 [Cycloclasticus sp. symbiont of Poecilosclerida sp. N]
MRLSVIRAKNYRPKQANEFAQQRHQQKNKHITLTAEIMGYIREKLKEYWSPEQIVGRLELDKKVKISAETAYRSVWATGRLI